MYESSLENMETSNYKIVKTKIWTDAESFDTTNFAHTNRKSHTKGCG